MKIDKELLKKAVPIVNAVVTLVGFGLSLYFTAKAAPKVQAKKKEMEEKGASKKETIVEVGKECAKPAVAIVLTTANIVGGMIFNHNQQVSLMAMAGTATKVAKDTKVRFMDAVGPEKVAEEVKKDISAYGEERTYRLHFNLHNDGDDQMYVFKATPYEVLGAQYDILVEFETEGSIHVDKMMDYFGLGGMVDDWMYDYSYDADYLYGDCGASFIEFNETPCGDAIDIYPIWPPINYEEWSNYKDYQYALEHDQIEKEDIL